MHDAVTSLLRGEIQRRMDERSPRRESAERDLEIATVRLKRTPTVQDRLIASYAKGLKLDDEMKEWGTIQP